MKNLIVMLFLVTINSSLMAQAPKVVMSDTDGWHKIGESKVDFKNETDKMLILVANRFSSLKIKVTEAPIKLESFIIYFDNKEKKIVPIGQEFKAPGETKKVDLGGEKNVKEVEFTYKTVGNQKEKKAHVELWGFKTNP
jgi:hypothetical protein